ncbi:MAG TPA: hypothetical protein VK455_04215 [Thermoplasmata archaeon]|nr:hypothetical protein [Thermoplasmata archaeon]
MSGGASAGTSGGFAGLAGKGCSTFVWGESRAAVNRVLFAVASDIDPDFVWLDIRHPTDESVEPGPVELGWIPNGRLLFTRAPSEARPQEPVAPAAIWRIVRSDDPDHEVASYADFLRLPAVTQKIIAGLAPTSGRRALAFANSDRVREFYPRKPEEIRPFLDAELAAGVIPLYGVAGPSGPGRMALDFVLEVRTPDLRHWREGTLMCEKAPPGSAFHRGDQLPLPSIPSVAAAFTRDRDWK